jgi:hypothetical protein
MPRTRFPTAASTAAAIRVSLDKNDFEGADRLVTELVGRVINASNEIPIGILDEPGSTGDERYDTLLAVGLAYALTPRGVEPRPWMEAASALSPEWLWDGDEVVSPEFRAYVRRNPPPMFRATPPRSGPADA